MFNRILLIAALLFQWLTPPQLAGLEIVNDLSKLNHSQRIADFQVANLYSDGEGKIMGAKFRHDRTGAPVFLLQIETVPQAYIWIDTPATSDKGLAHSLEHLLVRKGAKGRYLSLLADMRLAVTDAGTLRDFNYYSMSTSAGMSAFQEVLHTWLDALFHPDFTDVEAEREFYHFGVAGDPGSDSKHLVEQGTVYDEMQTGQNIYDYYFALVKRVFGDDNPLGFYSGGVPEKMRAVTPQEIRQFHSRHYRLGPTTGFIFVLDPKEDIGLFLKSISDEFQNLPRANSSSAPASIAEPKYPVHPSGDMEVNIYPFPAADESGPGEVRFSWKPIQVASQTELRLMQLFFQAVTDGQQSLLYKAVVDSKTRVVNSGATEVESEPFLANSPAFPVWNVGISGIPGNRINPDSVRELKNTVVAVLKQVSQYGDGSPELLEFNKLIANHARARHRSKNVHVRTPPLFGFPESDLSWKETFETLEMDPAFVKSLSEESVWKTIDQQLRSGSNLWRELIRKYHLLDGPYGMASRPSPQLLEQLEKQRQERVERKTKALMLRYNTGDATAAISRFEGEELLKTDQLQSLEAKRPKPRFTEHPPLTPDDTIRYRSLTLANVPAICTYFERPPTLDIGLSFDLHSVPQKYYKYLPMLPRFLDSTGLSEGGHVNSYSDVLGLIQERMYALSIDYGANAASRRGDLIVRARVADRDQFGAALLLLQRLMRSNYVDLANIDRLRDLVVHRVSFDESFTKQDEAAWIANPAYSFHRQNNPLFLALTSQFTQAHWDARLLWLLHKPVTPQEVAGLERFANGVLVPGLSRDALDQKLRDFKEEGLKQELVEYWRKNLSSFSDSEALDGLRKLASEVEQDLSTGPAKAVEEIRELQTIIFNRNALHLDLTVSESSFEQIRPALLAFVESIPSRSSTSRAEMSSTSFIMTKLRRRYGVQQAPSPWYIGFVNPDSVTGSVMFYSDFPGYSPIDRQTLIQILASKLFSGLGPQGFYMKTIEPGLAYGNSVASDLDLRVLWYYAERSPDIPTLLALVKSVASRATTFTDPRLVDYALGQTFKFSRSMLTFSQRGAALALDIRDGNDPAVVRRFSQEVLKAAADPNLLSQLTGAAVTSICGVLLDYKCDRQHAQELSTFLFIGSRATLSDIEHRLPIPKLLLVWPSDFWLD